MKRYLNRDYCKKFLDDIENRIVFFDIEKQIETFERIYNDIVF